MLNALVILSLGLLLGMRHATDPDHIIAVSTIVSRERSLGRAARIGAFWGLGHTAAIMAVGAPLILFRWTVSPRLGAMLELGVAFMLIFLGVASLIDLRRGESGARHSHLHEHGDVVHRHVHGHESDRHDDGAHGHAADRTALGMLDRVAGGSRAYSVVRPIVIGVVHGLAGSAAVALMVLATIRTPILAVAYLLVFGAGTILGMILLTLAVALPVVFAGGSATTTRRLRFAFALVSLAFGLFLAVDLGVPLARM